MKTKSKEMILKAKQLIKLVEMKKKIIKEEEDLKEFFKSQGENLIEADNVIILVSEVTKETLDKDALKLELGSKLNKFINVTTHKRVDVKKAA